MIEKAGFLKIPAFLLRKRAKSWLVILLLLNKS